MKFEKCDSREATHIMLADGVTVRQIAEQRPPDGSDEVRLVNNLYWTQASHIWQLGGEFVREIVPPKPWEDTFTLDNNIGGVPVVYLPGTFHGHKVRVTVEVVK